jgi:7-carboxy-7-deazaguanine synthase
MTQLYRVNDIYGAIQGEGSNVGIPMVILRLQGCSVGCVWCDQKETWSEDYTQHQVDIGSIIGTNPKWTWSDSNNIRDYIKQHHPGQQWVLVTGGEPAEQDLVELAECLHKAGYKIALETSGTARGHIGANFDWVCCSPKTGNPNNKSLIPEVLEYADELKFIVCRQHDLGEINDCIKKYWKDKDSNRICLQPVSASPSATQLCINWCQPRGWRLSIQLHKILEIR